MAKRKVVSKVVRFEVFKRDRFTCRYCGAKAPDVLLVIEHVVPVADGGGNDILNLVTACEPCNQGKGARRLDDTTRLHAERAELDRLAEYREQLRMMADWRNQLRDARLETLCEYYQTNTGRTFTEYGRSEFAKLLRSMRPPPTDEEVMDAIDGAVASYLEREPERVFTSLGAIIRTGRRSVTRPWLRELYYIRGILRNRVYVNERQVMRILEDAVQRGIEVDDLKEHAIECRNWTDFRERIGDA